MQVRAHGIENEIPSSYCTGLATRDIAIGTEIKGIHQEKMKVELTGTFNVPT